MNPTIFRQDGRQFFPFRREDVNLQERLPAEVFRVVFHKMMGYYLERVDAFELPPRLYGDTSSNAKRIMHTFDARSGTTGVLLAGEKGSGKSLLAKKICIDANVAGHPVLVITEPFCGDDFNEFMQKLNQPCVVFVDEFEKVYDDQAKQQQLLTLLDGAYTSKKLFVLTCNDKYRVNEHMRNRPGRLFYSIDFVGLSPEFVREYCEDVGLDTERTESVVGVSHAFEAFNFDMLKALVEEMQRFNEGAGQAIRLMNIKPTDDVITYDIKAEYNGQKLKMIGGSPTECPLNFDGVNDGAYAFTPENDTAEDEFDLYWEDDDKAQSKTFADGRLNIMRHNDRVAFRARFNASDITEFSRGKGAYILELEGLKVSFSRRGNTRRPSFHELV